MKYTSNRKNASPSRILAFSILWITNAFTAIRRSGKYLRLAFLLMSQAPLFSVIFPFQEEQESRTRNKEDGANRHNRSSAMIRFLRQSVARRSVSDERPGFFSVHEILEVIFIDDVIISIDDILQRAFDFAVMDISRVRENSLDVDALVFE